MDQEGFGRLYSNLWRVQSRKTRGLVSASLLKKFVEYLEYVEATLVQAGFVRKKMVLFATLAPGTTEKEYESQTHPIVHYFGPYTVVTYKDGDYHFQRVTGDSQWYWNCRSEPKKLGQIYFPPERAVCFSCLFGSASNITLANVLLSTISRMIFR